MSRTTGGAAGEGLPLTGPNVAEVHFAEPRADIQIRYPRLAFGLTQCPFCYV